MIEANLLNANLITVRTNGCKWKACSVSHLNFDGRMMKTVCSKNGRSKQSVSFLESVCGGELSATIKN